MVYNSSGLQLIRLPHAHDRVFLRASDLGRWPIVLHLISPTSVVTQISRYPPETIFLAWGCFSPIEPHIRRRRFVLGSQPHSFNICSITSSSQFYDGLFATKIIIVCHLVSIRSNFFFFLINMLISRRTPL